MKKNVYEAYVRILNEELVMAMGCTEPIAVAYAASIAAKVLGELPRKVEIYVSGNIIKNVKSVIVPNTNGMQGLQAAASAGIIAGDPTKKLLVISKVSLQQQNYIQKYMSEAEFFIREAMSDELFDIDIRLSGKVHQSACRITGKHTNVISVEKDGVEQLTYSVKMKQDNREEENKKIQGDRGLLEVEQIVNFANEVALEEVQDVLQRQIDCNMAIAKEGMEKEYGARIGKILLNSYGKDIHTRAKAMAAAGSDARMNGCELPVVINSGSGNQGITASVPVIVYAEDMGVDKERLYRALVISNLVTIHLKSGIGSLSAYCGATSAGCGAGAGICYIQGGQLKEIAHTIVNGLAINSGMICDGAKASCAAKIASSVEAGLLGMYMYKNGSQFRGGDGILAKGVEKTIHNINILAREGMRKTDDEIIKIMLSYSYLENKL